MRADKPEHQSVPSASFAHTRKDLDTILSGALHHYVALANWIELVRWQMDGAQAEHEKQRYRCMLSGDPAFADGGAEQELKDLAMVIAAVGASANEQPNRAPHTESETRAELEDA